MQRRQRASVLVLGLCLGAAPAAHANDLGEALHFIDGAIGAEGLEAYEAIAHKSKHEALGFLTARDIEPGGDLRAYDCAEDAVDGDYTLRTNGNERWSGRQCREMRFLREDLPGYQTMGPAPLHDRQLDPMYRRAEARTDVPAALLDAVVRFQSGRRPGLVSDDGRFGLMQLSPRLLAQQGIDTSNLLDPETNVLKGAEYIRKLTFQFSDLKMALAAYLDGPAAVARAGGIPDESDTLFFVREVMRLYYASIREFPTQIAAESMAFVWNWLE